MRRIATAAAVAALWIAAPAGALSPQPFTDVTPRGSKLILCPAQLGGGNGLAWLNFGETASGRDVLDLSAAGVDPPTPAARLQPLGGCASTSTTPAGATLITLNRTGFSEEHGRVFAIDRAATGANGPPIELSDNEDGQLASGALAGSGAAVVAWTESPESADFDRDRTTVHVAARDAGGAFARLGVVARPGTAGVENVATGIDDAGHAIVAWTQRVVGDDTFTTRVMVATRAPGGALSVPRELTAEIGGIAMRLAVGPTGEAVLAFSGDRGVLVATGTTRTGLDTPRVIATATSKQVAAVLSPPGAVAVAWTQARDEQGTREGVLVSDREPGGDFGAPHRLVPLGTPLAGVESDSLRLAGASDGRVLATWITVVADPDLEFAALPVAALRRADGVWEPAVALAGTCRATLDAFGSFDAAGQPRAVFVDNGVISAGDYGFPSDSRVLLVRLAGAPATPAPGPKVTLTAARRQILRAGKVRLRVRCARACDARVFAVIRRQSGSGSGLFPRYARLRAGRALRVSLERQSYFDDTGHQLDRDGTTVKVKLVVHACGSAGRMARVQRTIGVRVPLTRG